MAKRKPRTIRLAEMAELVARLDTASKSVRLPRQLRADLDTAADLLDTLFVTRVLAGPVTLKGRDDG